MAGKVFNKVFNKAFKTPSFDPENPLPYGGITDTQGNITRVITKEEHDAMLAKARKAFGKKR